jgi:hypothetical protein
MAVEGLESLNNIAENTEKTSLAISDLKEGLHEISPAPVVEAVEELNRSQQSMLASLTNIVEHLAPLKDILALIDKRSTEESLKDNAEAEKQKTDKQSSGKNTPNDSDVAKLPDIYGLPSLLLNTTLLSLRTELFEPQIEILKNINSNLGQVISLMNTEKKSKAEPAKAAKGTTEGPAKKETTTGLGPYVDLAKSLAELNMIAALVNLEFMSSFINIANNITNNIDPKKAELLTEFGETLKEGMDSFRGAIIATTISGALILPALMYLPFVKLFISNSIKMMDSIKLGQANKNAHKLAEFASDMSTTLKGLISFALQSMILSVIAIPAIVGIILTGLFIRAAMLAIPPGLAAKTKQITNLNKFSEQLRSSLQVLALAAVMATILIPLSITGIVGLLLSSLFVLTSGLLAKVSAGVNLSGIVKFAKSLKKAMLSLVIGMMLVVAVALLTPLALVGMLIISVFALTLIPISMYMGAMSVVALWGITRFAKKLSSAMISLSLALLLAAMMPIFIFMAMPGLIAIMGIMSVFVGIGSFMASIGNKSIMNFAKGAILLTIALVLFGLGMVLLGFFLWPWIVDALPKALLITGIFLVFVAIGAVISQFTGNLIKFAIGSILLTVALVLFGLGLWVLAKIAKEIDKLGGYAGLIKIGIAMIAAFALGIGIGLILIGPQMIALVLFAVGAVLLAVALIAFAFAVEKLTAVADKLTPDMLNVMPMIALIFLAGTFAAAFAVPFAALGVFIVVGCLLLIPIFKSLSIAANSVPSIEKLNGIIGISVSLLGMFAALAAAGVFAAIAIASLTVIALAINLPLVGVKALLKSLGKLSDELPIGAPKKILSVTKAITSIETMFQAINKSGELADKALDAAKAIKKAANATTDVLKAMTSAAKESKKMGSIDGIAQQITISHGILKALNDMAADAQTFETAKKSIQNAAKGIPGILKSLAKSKNADFGGIKQNIEVNLVEPLLALTEPIDNILKLTNNIRDLNTELNKLTKENKNTITSLGNIKGSGGFKINFPGGGKSSGESGGGGSALGKDPMESIATDVAAIREEVTKSPSSWAG